MSKLTDSLAAKLDHCSIGNFSEIYLFERELERIEEKHDLASPEVIAAIATVADVSAAQTRLIAQPAKALAKGLKLALGMKLRPTAKLLVEALLDGAQRSVTATPPSKKLPAFAQPSRLPPLDGDVEALLRALMTAKLGEPPDAPFAPESLARLGRALALGWLSHGAEPKHAWGAWAAGHFPDDATARDLGMMARELGPRTGQFSKAKVLVDVLAAMNTRTALDALQELATKVKTRSVKERAQLAFDAAAKRAGVSKHDLADKLLRDDAPVGKDFVRRLEERMVIGATMPAVELVENILQRDAVRAQAQGVVFGMKLRAKLVTFTIGVDDLVDVAGNPFVLPSNANVIVAHPIDMGARAVAKWRARIAEAPFPQLDRAFPRARAIKAAKQGAIYGLERFGWQRGRAVGGLLFGMTREISGITATIDFEPGIYLGRGAGAIDQRITKITIKGDGPERAIAELARELDTLR